MLTKTNKVVIVASLPTYITRRMITCPDSAYLKGKSQAQMDQVKITRVTWDISTDGRITGFGVTINDGSSYKVERQMEDDEEEAKTYSREITEKIVRIRVY